MYNTTESVARPDCKFVALTAALFGVVALFFYLTVANGQTPAEAPTADVRAELAVCQEALEACLRPKPAEDDVYMNGIDDLQKRIQTMQTQDPSDEQTAPVESSE